MARTPTGVAFSQNGSWRARVLLGGSRPNFHLPTCDYQAEAEQRARLLSEAASELNKAGRGKSAAARALIEELARSTPDGIAPTLDVLQRLCGGSLAEPTVVPVKSRHPSFETVGRMWTSGELAERHPDHVRLKTSADDDEQRLTVIGNTAVSGRRFGDLPIDEVTVEACEQVMRSLPERAKRPATRRQYAQVMARVLALAAYPLRLIPASPLPAGFLPRVGKPPAFAFLYPDEDAQLLRCSEVPWHRRLAYGVLCREGMRVSELVGLDVRDFDLKAGTVTLDATKTGEARTWAIGADVARTLAAWFRDRKAKTGDPAFIGDSGERLESAHLARQLRADLVAAGVRRHALHEDGPNSRRVRVHDLRGTFVTLALAAGRTETWVADRTGHRSSIMINRYRRAARTATETGMNGWLAPLDSFCPASVQTQGEGGGGGAKTAERRGPGAEESDSKSVASDGVSVRVRPSLQPEKAAE